MALIPRLLTTIGLILLAHAGYSAHEHALLPTPPSPSPTTTFPIPVQISVPADITLETLASLLLITTGLLLSVEPLRPISWSAWAGAIEERGGKENPWRGLEDGERRGFWDGRGNRKEFVRWMKGGKVGMGL